MKGTLTGCGNQWFIVEKGGSHKFSTTRSISSNAFYYNDIYYDRFVMKGVNVCFFFTDATKIVKAERHRYLTRGSVQLDG